MKTSINIILLMLASCGFVMSNNGIDRNTEKGRDKMGSTFKPPIAKRVKKELIKFGHKRIDNYYWLRNRKNSEVIDYLKSENKYLEKVMKHTEKFQSKLYKEITGRIKKDDSSVPYLDNGYFYYVRYKKGSEYPVYCRKKTMKSQEEILLDVNKMAEGYKFYNVTGLAVSTNNKLLAFGVDTVSRRKYTIYIKDLVTGKLLKNKIVNTTGRPVWANDNNTIYYSVKDKTLRSYKILKHRIGIDPEKDQIIFHEKDPTFSVYVFKSKSKKYIMIASQSTMTSEFRFLNADTPDGDFSIVHPRERGIEYSVSHFGDHFFIRTNYKAKNFRLVRTSVNKTGKENWEEVIPNRKDVYLSDFELFRNYLVLNEKKYGLNRFRVIKWDDKSEYYIDFGEETYSAYISVNREFTSDNLRYGYSSMTTPNSVFDYDMNNKKKKLLKRDEVLGNFNPENYKTKRFFASAGDETKIPISLVYRKDKFLKGNNPLYIYGYGSYGFSMSASFRSDRLSLLDRGFIFAIAHVRGGQEMGRHWYEDGKLLKKKNTFTDFIDCTRFLLKEGYGNPYKVFAMGGSAGGLLMGAIVNMAPELFSGIIAHVPWVDVVTTMLDDTIPLTTSEYDEWGNPNEKKYYDYMLSYSPYDNVKKGKFPAMLVTTGLHDSQVQYWEPAKWVAKIRYLKTDNNVLLLHTNMDAGHGGASGRFRRYKEKALEYAFIFDLLGIKD